MSKKIILGVAGGLAAVTILGMSVMPTLASAHGNTGDQPSLIDQIAKRFNLKSNDITDVFTQYHEQRHQEMESRFENNLDQASKDGKITETQKKMMEEKHEEMEKMMEDNYKLSPEERRDNIAKHHEEMQSWSEENGIDMHEMMMGNGGFGRGSHRGMMDNSGMWK